MGRRRPPPRFVAAARAHGAYPPTILEARDGLLVCDKPAGLASTGRDLDDPDCLQAHLVAHEGRDVWAVHQLDRDTSGVNLFVTRRALVDEWARALKGGAKTYLAIGCGVWTQGDLVITAPIERVDGQPRVVAEGRPTQTRVTPIATTTDASLLSVRIETGRTHQVRLHLAHVGHPIWGDARYGIASDTRQLLHAYRVRTSGGEWTAPLPADFRAFLDARSWEPGLDASFTAPPA